MYDLLSTVWPYHLPPVPMFQTDADGSLQHMNRHCLTLLALEPHEIEGRALAGLMSADAGEQYRQLMQDGPAAVRDLEAQFITGQGAVIDVLLSVSVQPDATGRAVVLGTMTDLTLRRAAEREASRAAALLGSVITGANDAILITEAEPIGAPGPRILYANPAFCAMTGYSAEEILGQSPRILQGPKTDRRELDRLRRALLAWQSVRVELVNYTKNGTEFIVEMDISPVADADGIFTHWVSIQRNITTRRRQEEQRLSTLIEGVPQLIWRSCGEGDWTWASPQWMDYTGQSREESLGRGWLDAVHPDDQDATITAWHAARSHGLLDVEFRVRRALGGAYVWHHTRSVPVRDENGHIVEWLGATSDIQDLKEMQQRQQVLLAELQHRTRNLLAVVQSISRQTVRRSASLAEFAVEYEGRLAALSRVQGLLARGNQETLDLRQLVEAELTAHGSGPPGKIWVEGPPVALAATAVQTLALALHELATNAVKYGALGQPAGKLRVAWHLEDEGGKRRVTLQWHESQVAMPPDGRSERKGYGTELIERALPYQLKARTQLAFGQDGVRCCIVLPIGTVEANHD